jgi:hypothetical protein
MDSADRACVWLIFLVVIARFLFGGDPDVTDVIIKHLSK